MMPDIFFFFKTHYVHGDPIRGPKVRRRSRTDSGLGQLIVPPLRVLFTGYTKVASKSQMMPDIYRGQVSEEPSERALQGSMVE